MRIEVKTWGRGYVRLTVSDYDFRKKMQTVYATIPDELVCADPVFFQKLTDLLINTLKARIGI